MAKKRQCSPVAEMSFAELLNLYIGWRIMGFIVEVWNGWRYRATSSCNASQFTTFFSGFRM